MTDRSSVALRVRGPRASITGLGDSLENVNTTELPDGTLCYVTGSGRFELQLSPNPSIVPDGISSVRPAAGGPGLWLLLPNSLIVDAGTPVPQRSELEFTGSGITITDDPVHNRTNVHVSGTVFPVPFPVSDIDATGIPDGYVVQAASQIAIWGPVPVAFAIESFNYTGASLVEVGTTVTHPAFTASYNQTPTSVTLSDTDGGSNAVALPATSFSSVHTFLKVVFGQSVTFTLAASNPLGSGSKTQTISWGENVYFGPAIDPGTYNAAFITSLGADLVLNPAGNYGINAPGSDSSFFCALSSLGLTTANFFVGGFPFACSVVAAGVSVTNTHGVTNTYDVFRSDNVGLGAYTLQVT
jgi:hypothetical protein